MVKEAAKHIGLGEPNFVQSWYRKRNGADYAGNFAWCDAFVTYCAYVSGNAKAVNPKGDRAYTVTHAQDFQKSGRWYSGTEENLRKAKPGDIVFFDWNGSNSIGAIDHVGIVERVKGSTLYTIEGNISDHVMRKVRDASTVAGYGRPAYGGEVPPKYWVIGGHSVPQGEIELSKGSSGAPVKALQDVLNWTLATGLQLDGDFGEATEGAVKKLQKASHLDVDGSYGPKSAAALKALAEGKVNVTTPAPAPAPSPVPTNPAPPKEVAPAGVLLDIAKAVLQGDGILPSPPGTPESNPHWTLQSYVYYTYLAVQDVKARQAGIEAKLDMILSKLDAQGSQEPVDPTP